MDAFVAIITSIFCTFRHAADFFGDVNGRSGVFFAHVGSPRLDFIERLREFVMELLFCEGRI